MSEHDSDSSLDGLADGTATNVNLGYASREPMGDTISHLGGFSSWLDPSTSPPASFARCKICRANTSLLIQLNCDLPEQFPNDERRLHLFACRKKPCQRKLGSVRVLREVKKHKSDGTEHMNSGHVPAQTISEKSPGDLGATIFGVVGAHYVSGTANPFSLSTQSSPVPFLPEHNPPSLASNPEPTAQLGRQPRDSLAETFASKLRMSPGPSGSPSSSSPLPLDPWPREHAFPRPHPYLYLDAEYEMLATSLAYSDRQSISVQIPALEDGDSTSAGSEKDLFESSLDRTFQKFSERLSHNPEQVLRYEWGGRPLLYSSTDSVGRQLIESSEKTKLATSMPRCESCGAERVFEMQLVPGAISALEEDDLNLEDGMDWGTIIVGVCTRNCGDIGEVTFREEWCGVQWEETG